MTTPTIEVGELLRAADAGEALVLLDVRNDEDFANWRIDCRRKIQTIHVPYFAFLEEPEASIARIPRNSSIVALCAKGGSSELVVELLREAGVSARNVVGGMAAYGDHLEASAVPVLSKMAAHRGIWQINRRGKGCLSYIVREGTEALVIDPSRRIDWYIDFAASHGARIVRVLDTHVHADHVSGGPALAEKVGAPYSVGVATDVKHSHENLSDGQRLNLGGASKTALELTVIATPGHTPGSASFLLDGRYLFSGDTLFVHGVGRPDLGGQAEEWGRALFRTLHVRLAELTDGTLVLPAHSAGLVEARADGVIATKLGSIRRAPEFGIALEDDFVRSVTSKVQPPPESYASIIPANLGQSTVDPERAAEWELGMNRCAASAPPPVH